MQQSPDTKNLAVKREYLELLEERARRQRRRKLFDLYPEEGPLRRELYPKHLEVFALGATHRERAFIAANRIGKCVTYETVIDACVGERTAGELFDAAEPFMVWAWDGSQKVRANATAPFKKSGIHDCFRFSMSDGRWFEGADHHRILTCDGWHFLDELHQSSSVALLASNSERDQLVRAASVPYWSGKLRDFLLNCFEDFRQYGEPPQFLPNIAQAFFPLPAGVQQHIVASFYSDDRANRRTNSGRQAFDRPSNQDAILRLLDRFVVSAARSVCTNAQWLRDLAQDVRQLHPGSIFGFRSGLEVRPHIGDKSRALLQTPNVDGAYIIASNPVGRKEVYDFGVEEYHNYLAAGVVHHNTWGVGAYETTLHLTGRYPDWWVGKRFDEPVDFWAAGKTNETTRDIVQQALFGSVEFLNGRKAPNGEGMVPGDDILDWNFKSGVVDLLDTVMVRHVTGGKSSLGLKTYAQGRGAFEGTAKHGIWIDEEPEMPVYTECLTRTMTTDGLVLATFTPLEGMSDVVMAYLHPEEGRL